MSHGMWHAPQEIRMRDSCISVAYAAALICLLMVLVFSLAWSHEQPLDDHSSWSVNPSNLSIAKPAAMMCARGLLNGRTCCRASCGTCGGAGCRYRLGGARMCCPAAIAAAEGATSASSTGLSATVVEGKPQPLESMLAKVLAEKLGVEAP